MKIRPPGQEALTRDRASTKALHNAARPPWRPALSRAGPIHYRARMRRGMVVLLGLGLGLVACSRGGAPEVERDLADTITVTSTALAEGAPPPGRFTGADADVSPPLAWSGVPGETAELALVVDDPDAPGGTYVRWRWEESRG